MVESARRTGRYSDADRYPTADAAAVYYAAVHVNGKAENWHTLSGYDKFNTLAWELISHLWFLLVLVVLTSLGVVLFKWLTRRPTGGASAFGDYCHYGPANDDFPCAGGALRADPPIAVLIYPPLLSNGLFNFVVMQTLFYLPFFVLGRRPLLIRV